jgi:hypothetical protein
MCSALGAVYLRIVWDTTVSDRPWIQAVPVDVAVPQFSYDKLRSVTFWQVVDDDGTDVTRHLEMHVPQSNQILHGLYQGDQTDLGESVPLGMHPSTAGLGASLPDGTLTLPDLPFDASTVVYIPNMRPNKIWRDLGPEFWPLGRSDYQGVEPLMDSLDAVYSSWMRDVELAVMRLIVPPEYLDDIGKGKGAVFEPDRRVFTPLNMLHDSGAAPSITANQFAIRWAEHQNTCQDLVNRIIQESGYSPQSFGDYDRSGSGGAVTATEIEARERVSLLTRQKKITYWRPCLQDIIYSLMCVAREYFGATAITPERPDINFAAVALPDEAALAQTVATLAGAEAASKRTLVAMAHPSWTETEVLEEVAQIRSEIGTELAAHARIALAQPPGTTIEEVEAGLENVIPAPPELDEGNDAQTDQSEAGPS